MKKIAGIVFALLFFSVSAVADDTISSGLTLVIPSQGAKGWATTFKNSFATPISGHDHTGGGKGLQISTNAIATNAVTESKIRLTNNSYLKARNAANSADVNILKLNASDQIEFATVPTGIITSATFSPTLTSNPGSLSSVVCDDCRYAQLGKTIQFSVSATFTVTGSPTEIRITPPVAGTASASSVRYPANVEISGSGFMDSGYWRLDATNGIVVKQFLGSAWTAGTTRRIHLQGTYVIP